MIAFLCTRCTHFIKSVVGQTMIIIKNITRHIDTINMIIIKNITRHSDTITPPR